MNLTERMLTGGLGPFPAGGATYVACMGTAVPFSNGINTNYSGYGLYNPLGTGTQTSVKAIINYTTLVPTSNGTSITTVGLSKVFPSSGTCTGFSNGGQNSSTGVVFACGVYTPGNSQPNTGTSTSCRCQVIGTGSFMSAPVQFQFSNAFGTGGIPDTGESLQPYQAELQLMPGEAAVITMSTGGTAVASICWSEVPL